MTSEPKPKIQRWDTTLICIFYLVSGIAYFIILGLDLRNLAAILLGSLSLIIAYGLLKTKNWILPFAIALFFPQITFEIVALITSIATIAFGSTIGALLFHLALIIHMILLTLCLLYVAAKRKEFQP